MKVIRVKLNITTLLFTAQSSIQHAGFPQVQARKVLLLINKDLLETVQDVDNYIKLNIIAPNLDGAQMLSTSLSIQDYVLLFTQPSEVLRDEDIVDYTVTYLMAPSQHGSCFSSLENMIDGRARTVSTANPARSQTDPPTIVVGSTENTMNKKKRKRRPKKRKLKAPPELQQQSSHIGMDLSTANHPVPNREIIISRCRSDSSDSSTSSSTSSSSSVTSNASTLEPLSKNVVSEKANSLSDAQCNRQADNKNAPSIPVVDVRSLWNFYSTKRQNSNSSILAGHTVPQSSPNENQREIRRVRKKRKIDVLKELQEVESVVPSMSNASRKVQVLSPAILQEGQILSFKMLILDEHTKCPTLSSTIEGQIVQIDTTDALDPTITINQIHSNSAGDSAAEYQFSDLLEACVNISWNDEPPGAVVTSDRDEIMESSNLFDDEFSELLQKKRQLLL